MVGGTLHQIKKVCPAIQYTEHTKFDQRRSSGAVVRQGGKGIYFEAIGPEKTNATRTHEKGSIVKDTGGITRNTRVIQARTRGRSTVQTRSTGARRLSRACRDRERACDGGLGEEAHVRLMKVVEKWCTKNLSAEKLERGNNAQRIRLCAPGPNIVAQLQRDYRKGKEGVLATVEDGVGSAARIPRKKSRM